MHFGLAVVYPFPEDGPPTNEATDEVKENFSEQMGLYISTQIKPYFGETKKLDGYHWTNIDRVSSTPPTSAPYAFIGVEDHRWYERRRESYRVEEEHSHAWYEYMRSIMVKGELPKNYLKKMAKWDEEHPDPITPWHLRFHRELQKVEHDGLVFWFDCHR
jgi:hypothetical protein